MASYSRLANLSDDDEKKPKGASRLATLADEEAQATPVDATPWWARALNTVGEAGINNVEAAAKFGSGMVGGIVGGAAGLGAIPANALGLTDADPEDVQNFVSNSLTYQPSNPESMASKVVDLPGNMLGGAKNFLQKAGDSTGLPYVGGLMGAIPEVALNLLGVKGARALKGGVALDESPLAKSAEAIDRTSHVDRAIEQGYSVPPRSAGATVGGALESATNSAKLERTLAAKNQPITNKIARSEAGIGGEGPITQMELSEARKPLHAVYEEVAKSGRVVADQQFAKDMFSVGKRTAEADADFPMASSGAVTKLRNAYLEPEFNARSAIDHIRQLRKDAGSYFKAVGDPEKQALGHASKQIANALEGALERHLEENGQAGLMDKFRGARQQLAKINNIEDAVSETTGNVDALHFGKLLDKGAPLSGGLADIGHMARRFRNSMKLPETLPASGPGALTTGAGMLTAAVSGTLSPLTLIGAPMAVRKILASKTYQNTLHSAAKKPTIGTPLRRIGAAEAPDDNE